LARQKHHTFTKAHKPRHRSKPL